MNRMGTWVGLALLVSSGSAARAESPAPQAYTLRAEGRLADRRTTVTIVRDGGRERVETAIEVPDRRLVTTSLYDFEAHRVYWIGWSGAGSCSSGRYLSARAPVGEDPVTGTAESLAELTKGRTRKAAGAGPIAGRPARIEAFVGGKRPKDPGEPWPTRAWLSEDGGSLLKLEGEGAKGQPVTLLEVTQLTFGRPGGAPLQPPPECTATDSEMDDAGNLRSHAEGSVEAKATATADLGSGSTGATVTRADGKPASPAAPGALARLGAVSLSAAERPDAGPCGTRLELTGTLAADGPATIWYRFYASVGGVQFPTGQVGTVTLDAAGSASVTREATVPRALKGQLRLQASVQGTKGHNGPLRTSDPVPFDVTCAGK